MDKTPEYYLADISKLLPYAQNARTHSTEQIAQIAASIKEFGFLAPIVVAEDNTILCGHGRFYAAQKLGLRKIPCIKETHLTEAQRRAYIIADNKLSLNAGWDEELLAVELTDLQEDNFDLSLLGFDDKELADLFSEENKTGAADDNFDLTAALENENGGEVIPQTQNAAHGANFGLTVEMPKECVDLEKINNLLAAKGELIKRALGLDALQIEVTEYTVKFPWFDRQLSPDEGQAYAHFIAELCKMSVKSKRISPKPKPIVNEKYEFRCFLLRLGFIGSEYKNERKVLLEKLEGSSAFKSPKQQS